MLFHWIQTLQFDNLSIESMFACVALSLSLFVVCMCERARVRPWCAVQRACMAQLKFPEGCRHFSRLLPFRILSVVCHTCTSRGDGISQRRTAQLNSAQLTVLHDKRQKRKLQIYYASASTSHSMYIWTARIYLARLLLPRWSLSQIILEFS